MKNIFRIPTPPALKTEQDIATYMEWDGSLRRTFSAHRVAFVFISILQIAAWFAPLLGIRSIYSLALICVLGMAGLGLIRRMMNIARLGKSEAQRGVDFCNAYFREAAK